MIGKAVKLEKASKRTRNKPARFESTPEWNVLKRVLDKDAIAPNTALPVVLTKEEQKRYRITNRRTFARFVRKYIKARALKYSVQSFEIREPRTFDGLSLDEGAFVVRIINDRASLKHNIA